MNSIRTRPKFRKSKFFLIFGAFWLLFGVPFILFGINEWNTNRRFERDAVKVVGTAISKRIEEKWDSKEKRTDTYYYVKYRFKSDDLREIEHEQGVDKETWQRIKEDSPVDIEYLKEAVDYNRIAGTASDFGSYITVILGSIMSLIGAVIVGFDLKKRLHTARILKNGLEAIGTVTSIQGSSLTVNDVVQVNVLYNFKDRMGREYNGISNYHNPKLLKDITTGSPCKIAYDKDDPTQNMLLSV